MNAPESIQKHYAHLSYNTDVQRWLISNIEPHVAIRLKRMFPRIAEGKAGTFHVSDTPDMAADLVWFFQRYPVTADSDCLDRLQKRSEGYYDLQAEADRIRLPDYTPIERTGLRPGQRFRWYQGSFLDWADIVRKGLLIDAVGIGKTYSGLGLRILINDGPLLVVVQPHLQKQWGKKAAEFIDARIHLLKGTTPYDLPDADIYIAKYTQLSGWVDVLSSGWIKSLAFDEVQELRHGTETNKGVAANSIIQATPNAFGLTGTLIYGYGIEAYNIINMFRPGLLGSASEFIREWCTDSRSGNGKKVVKDPDALGAYLREQNVILRRTKKDVGIAAKQLAPEIYWVDADEKAVDDNEALTQQLAMTALTGSFTEAGQAAREFDMRMRELTGIAKAKSVAALARMMVESGTPLILYGWHRAVYDIWLAELADLNPVMFTGSETPTQKERAKQAFITGETNLLIMSLRSGAGTDGLQYRCSDVLFGELDHSPQIHEQGIGRVDRDGQEEEVFATFAVTNYGSDPVMMDVAGIKEGQARGIQDPGMAKEQRQADPDRIKKMARAFLKQKGVVVPERTADEPPAVDPTSEEQLSLI